jgi:peptide/nickel transport system substrate-binding protein/oligopeptide transport system substrate-binding protein
VFSLANCGHGSSAPTPGKPVKAPRSQQVFRSPIIDSDISTFDPAQVTDLNSIAAIDMVFTGLVSENDQLEVQPQLAQDYHSSPDGLTWTFHLRSNLKFSDGLSLTSQDVAYSIDRALSPQIAGLNGVSLTYLGLIQGAADRLNGRLASLIGTSIQILDASTVVIHITKRSMYFLQALTYPTSYIVEKKVIDQWGLKWTDHLSENGGQGGDGPFKVQSYNHSTGITFVPNPNYYGRKPQLQKVIDPFIKNTDTNYAEYQADQVDATTVPTAHYSQARTLGNQFHRVPQLWINYYGLNYLVKPFNNIKIRQALELAINKDVIAQTIWGGRLIPTNHIVPGGMIGYNENLTGPNRVGTKGDVAQAKSLFAQGLQEEHLTLENFPTIKFTYSTTSSDTANEITTVIQMWQQVLGITSIRPDPVDSTTLFAEIALTTNNTHLALWKVDWIADYPDPQDWITLQFAKGSSENNVNFGQNQSSASAQQQKLQQQMELADSMSDQAARIRLYNQIEQQLVNDVAWLPMQQVVATYLLKPYVIGIVDTDQNLIPPDDWGSIYIAVH